MRQRCAVQREAMRVRRMAKRSEPELGRPGGKGSDGGAELLSGRCGWCKGPAGEGRERVAALALGFLPLTGAFCPAARAALARSSSVGSCSLRLCCFFILLLLALSRLHKCNLLLLEISGGHCSCDTQCNRCDLPVFCCCLRGGLGRKREGVRCALSPHSLQPKFLSCHLL